MARLANSSSDLSVYFLLLGSDNHSVGTLVASFGTFNEALNAIRQQGVSLFTGSAPETEARELEIVCQRPATKYRLAPKPHFQFHVNARTNGTGGEGTELSPWWGLPFAVDNLSRLHQAGELCLQEGQSLRLSHREVFTPSPLEKRKKVYEAIAKYIFMAMTLSLVVPLLAILGYILVIAWPALSVSFLWENPRNFMREGCIWAPLIGTFFLVLLSLLVAAPIGILAGLYLN